MAKVYRVEVIDERFGNADKMDFEDVLEACAYTVELISECEKIGPKSEAKKAVRFSEIEIEETNLGKIERVVFSN